MTFKLRSRSPKSELLFPSSQQCIYSTSVKNHPLVQKIMHRNHISDISKCSCDLENKVKVTKSNQFVPPSQQCICTSVVKIHQAVHKIAHRKEATRTPMPTGSTPKTICSNSIRLGGHIISIACKAEELNVIFNLQQRII